MRKWWRGTLASSALLLAILAGCASNVSRLAPLRIAGLQRLDGVSNLAQETTDATLFQQGAAQRLLLRAGDLAVVDLNGAHERWITLAHPCWSDPAVTPDGQWVACLSSLPDGSAVNLEVASLRASDARHWERTFTATSEGYQLAWSPDGRYLAVVNHAAAPHCGIDVYVAEDGYSQFALVTRVTSPFFLEYGECVVSAAGWSHDGARLLVAVTQNQETSVWVAEQTPVASLIQSGFSGNTIPNYTVPLAAFTLVTSATTPTFGRFAWNPRTDALAVMFSGKLLSYATGPAGTPATAQPSALFTLPEPGFVYSIAWAPDGAKLALVFGPGPKQCVDYCGPQPQRRMDVYLYTPPSTG